MGVKEPVPKVGGGPTLHFYGLVGFFRFVSMGFDGIFGSRVHIRGVWGVKPVLGANLGFWRGCMFKATAP